MHFKRTCVSVLRLLSEWHATDTSLSMLTWYRHGSHRDWHAGADMQGKVYFSYFVFLGDNVPFPYNLGSPGSQYPPPPPPHQISVLWFLKALKSWESLVYSLRHCVLVVTLMLNDHLQKSYKQHLEWLRAAPEGVAETDRIVLQMILKMWKVSDCATLVCVDIQPTCQRPHLWLIRMVLFLEWS